MYDQTLLMISILYIHSKYKYDMLYILLYYIYAIA